MKTRPKVLTLFSMALLAMAISFPIQIMILYDHGISEWPAVFSKLTWLNYFVMSYLTINAAIILRGSSLAILTLPTGMMVMAFNNYFVGVMETDYSSTTSWVATGLYCSFHLVLCQPKIIDIMKYQERRWWLTPVRKKVAVMALVTRYNGMSFTSKTFDLSEQGAFVPLTKLNTYLDDRVSICLTLDNSSQIQCDARIVRFNTKEGRYPIGVGMKFDDLGYGQRRELKRYLNQVAM